jgi:tetratricopeptide (TPR) repeat protein
MGSNKQWFASLICLNLVLAEGAISQTIAAPIAQAQAVPSEVREGYGLLGKGWVSDAIAVFQRAVQRYPQSLEARLGLAIAYRRNGQDAEAFQVYEQVLAIDPNNQLALKSVGLLGGFRPEWQTRGIAALTTLLSLTPNDTEARAQRALLYGYQGQFAEALADYEIALQGNPTPDVLLGAAQVYTYNSNYEQGLALFDRYRQATRQPITGFAALAYARALRNTGNPEQAVQLLEPQLAGAKPIDDLNIQLRVELSQAYLATQRETQALAILDPLRGRTDALLPLARGLNEVGRQANQPTLITEAATLYRQALAQTPNPSPLLLREVADVLSSQPQEREFALQLYRQVAIAQPDDRAVQIKLLALENQLGNLSQVELRQRLRSLLDPLPSDRVQQQAIAQALVRVEPDPEFLPIYETLIQSGATATEPFLNFRVAQILLERNDVTGARNALAAYTSTLQARGDLAPQLVAAEIERREGDLEASARRYAAVIAANPVDPDVGMAALRELAGVRLAQGRPNEALQLYDELVAHNPNNLQIQVGRASVAYQANRISAAEAETVLNTWLSSRPATDTPPELFSLVGALPPAPQREALYLSLVEADPDYLPVQLRLVQVLADRDPAAARARVNEIVSRSQANGTGNTVEAYLVQGQLAEAIGDVRLADQSFQAALTQQPSNADALIGLGNLRLQQRQFTAAEQFLDRALTLRPNDVGIQRSLIEVKVGQDYPLQALQQLKQLQFQQVAGADSDLAQRRQKIEEDFLQRRGFQPPWERF